MSKSLKEYKEVDVASILYGMGSTKKPNMGRYSTANNPALSPEMGGLRHPRILVPCPTRIGLPGIQFWPSTIMMTQAPDMASTYMAEAGLLHTRSWGSNKDDPKVCDGIQITATVKDHLLSHSSPNKEYLNIFSGENAMCTTVRSTTVQ